MISNMMDELLSMTARSLVVSRTLKPLNHFLRFPKPNTIIISILQKYHVINDLTNYMHKILCVLVPIYAILLIINYTD